MGIRNIPFGAGYLSWQNTSTGVYYPHVADVQEFSLSVKTTTVDAIGSYGVALGKYTTERKVTGKAKTIIYDPAFVAAVVGGTTSAGGRIDTVYQAAAAASITVPASLTGTGIYAFKGVLDDNDSPMAVTASAPAVGSYAANTSTGVVTLNAAQTGNVKILFAYSTGSGVTTTWTNALMGAVPSFQANFQNVSGQKYNAVRLNAVAIPNIDLTFKNTALTDYNVDFEVFADSSNNIGEFYNA